MSRFVRALFLIAALCTAGRSQQKGDLPPVLLWDQVEGHCPAKLDWKNLMGSTVVVSLGSDDVFPEDIAEWNEVPQALQGEPVVFIQVVSGSAFLLDQALKKTAYMGCILLDSHDANRANFKLPNAPRTVVVDRMGYIAGYAQGTADADEIRSVLNHESETGLSPLPFQLQQQTFRASAEPVSYDVHIASAQPGDRRVFGPEMSDTYSLRNQPLKLAILDLWETPLARISLPKDLDPRNYNITAHIPVPDRALLLRLVQDAIQNQLGLRVHLELRTEHVYLLTAKSTSSQLKPAGKEGRWMTGGGQGSIIGTSQTMPDIAKAFEGLLEVPVLDETNLQGKYDYSASSKFAGIDAALDMARQLGLEITPADRPIQMLVVNKVN
jgi:uncharacterized protein (TIGR03435 family)